MRLRHAWLLAAVVGCGSPTNVAKDAPPIMAAGSIGPSGGDVSAGDAASVAVPPGALATTVSITVSSTATAPPADTDAVGDAFVFGPEGQQFAVPATITLAFDPAAIPADLTASDIVIFTAPAGTTDFTALATSLADATHVSSETTHFSIFVPALHHKPKHDAGVDDAPMAASDAGMDAQATCTPVKALNGTQAICSYSATCNAHSYAVNCGQPTGACTCSVDGVLGQQLVNEGATCAGTTGSPAWGLCGFP